MYLPRRPDAPLPSRELGSALQLKPRGEPGGRALAASRSPGGVQDGTAPGRVEERSGSRLERSRPKPAGHSERTGPIATRSREVARTGHAEFNADSGLEPRGRGLVEGA